MFLRNLAGPALAAVSLVAGVSTTPQSVTPVVETEASKVQGLEQDGVDAFLGIRYAAAPVGELRFQPPIPAESWAGIADATGYGAPCMQLYTASGPRTT